MNKLSTYLFHSFSLLELKKCFLGVAHQRLLLGLKQCWEGWSSVIASPYMVSVLWFSFSNMSKSLWLNLLRSPLVMQTYRLVTIGEICGWLYPPLTCHQPYSSMTVFYFL